MTTVRYRLRLRDGKGNVRRIETDDCTVVDAIVRHFRGGEVMIDRYRGVGPDPVWMQDEESDQEEATRCSCKPSS